MWTEEQINKKMNCHPKGHTPSQKYVQGLICVILTMDHCRSSEFSALQDCVDGSTKHQNNRCPFQDRRLCHFSLRSAR